MLFHTLDETEVILRGIKQDIDSFNSFELESSNIKHVYFLIFDELKPVKFCCQVFDLMNFSCLEKSNSKGFRIAAITEWGIWPSSENLTAYYRRRRARGDRQELRQAPCHLFSAHEQLDFFLFVAMFLRFGWGGLLAGNSDGVSIAFNHDSGAWIFAHDERLDIEGEIKKWERKYEKLK